MSNEPNTEKDLCPSCLLRGEEVEFEYAYVIDVPAGDVILSANVTYCPHCLYQSDSLIELSK